MDDFWQGFEKQALVGALAKPFLGATKWLGRKMKSDPLKAGLGLAGAAEGVSVAKGGMSGSDASKGLAQMANKVTGVGGTH